MASKKQFSKDHLYVHRLVLTDASRPSQPQSYLEDDGSGNLKLFTSAGVGTVFSVDASGNPVTTQGVGAKNGSAVTVVEYGSHAVHRSVFTLTALSITMTDAGAAGCHGSHKLYDFPAGAIQILGSSYNLTTLAGAGGIGDTAALVGSLGSVTTATDNATLTTTEADLIASTAGTLTAGAGTLKKHGSLVATAFDGTSTAMDAFLNLAVPDADSSASDTITVSGTVTIVWSNLGDF